MNEAIYLPREHAAEKGSLEQKLVWLEEYANRRAPDDRLLKWGQAHLGLGLDTAKSWSLRAWWGIAAGELVRVYLYDRDLRKEALALLDYADWSLVDHALDCGGVILAAAHLGPPKLAMNAIIERFNGPLILTNTKDMPDWLPELTGPILDPMIASSRPEIMVKSALHLRAGGLMFCAPDGGYSAEYIEISQFGKIWRFSPGVPALARMLHVSCFTFLALWDGVNVVLRPIPINMPDPALPAQEWHLAWIHGYWKTMAAVIKTSPENLRFLSGQFRREMDTHDLV